MLNKKRTTLKQTMAVLGIATLAGVGSMDVLPMASAKADTGIQLASCSPCRGYNPCQAKKRCGACNPCQAKKRCGACNPCQAKARCGGCNPCKAKEKK